MHLRSLTLAILSFALLAPLAAQDNAAPGAAAANVPLDVRRRLDFVKTTSVPGFLKEARQIASPALEVDVNWSSFEMDPDAIGSLNPNGCEKVLKAFRAIAKDKLGKDALDKGIKRVAFANVADGKDSKVVVADGVLKIDWGFGKGHRSNPAALEELLRKALNQAL